MRSIVLSFLVLCCACGDDGPPQDEVDSAPPPQIDASWQPPPDAPPGQPDAWVFMPPDAMVCEAVANTAPVIPLQLSTQPRPPASGGAIQNGTYYLTSDILYGQGMDMQVAQEQATAQITGDTMLMVLVVNDGMPALTTSTFTTNGNTMTMTQTCPQGDVQTWDEYTAAGTTLALHSTEADRVRTFERQ